MSASICPAILLARHRSVRCRADWGRGKKGSLDSIKAPPSKSPARPFELVDSNLEGGRGTTKKTQNNVQSQTKRRFPALPLRKWHRSLFHEAQIKGAGRSAPFSRIAVCIKVSREEKCEVKKLSLSCLNLNLRGAFGRRCSAESGTQHSERS